MSKYAVMAEEILKATGGKGNIQSFTNCMTRLRITPVDASIIDEAKVKSIEGVLGVVKEGGTFQVIVGPGVVTKVAAEFGNLVGTSDTFSTEEMQAKGAQMKAEQKQRNDTKFKNALRSIGNIFIPLIPAFVGAGVLAGISAIMSNNVTAGNLSEENFGQYIAILNIIKNAVFSYLVIYIGINAAKEFGGTPALGGVIGGTTLLTGMNPENPIKNIFTGDPLTAGQGGVIGVIIAVWILCFAEKQLRKVVPDAVDIIVTPTIALFVVGLVTIFFIMPFAGLISDSLVGVMNWVLAQGGAFAGFILGATFLPLVMLGLHQILTPVHIEMINTTGVTLLLPVLAMAGAGQVGACIAIWVRCRENKPLTNILKGALPVGVLGIGEPLIYGVTLPLGKPFITACIGGGVGGAVIGFFGNVGAISIGPSGITLIPLIADGKWIFYVIGLLSAYAGGFVATYFFGVPKEAMVKVD